MWYGGKTAAVGERQSRLKYRAAHTLELTEADKSLTFGGGR